MRDFYQGTYNLGEYERARSDPYSKAVLAVGMLWLFFLGPILTLPLITWAMTKPSVRFGRFISRKTRFLLLVCLVSAPGLLLPIYVPQPHYAAPLTGAIYAIVLQAMRHSRLWRWGGRPSGTTIVVSVPIVCAALLIFRAVVPVSPSPLFHEAPHFDRLRTWASPQFGNVGRAGALSQLTRNPGTHLVIVRYNPIHDVVFNEWVYNDADIDHSKVVWAREMSPEQDQELIRYFKDRTVWLAEADEKPPRISPYHLPSVQ